MNTPLYNILIKYSDEKIAFHMPGHKFGRAIALNEINLALLDNTEVDGLDNLYEAEGIIKEASILMAEFYGAKETIFLTNGSTVGILTSILTVCHPGDKILVARNSHHSVWSGLILSGAVPIYINPKYKADEDLLGEISLTDIKEAVERYPDLKAVILVSPTYEGIVSDIKGIADYLHQENKILIVDEAHGAHFILGDEFPVSSVKLGADIVINSLHKTLPSLTQSALLHICSERIEYRKVIGTLRMVQTSSPSYMMMGIMDYMRGYILENRECILYSYAKQLIEMRESLKQLQHLKLIDFPGESYDRSKIIISTKETPIDGHELAKWLDRDYNIVVEAALNTYIILMSTLADDQFTLNKLKDALVEIDNKLLTCTPREVMSNSFLENNIVKGMSPREVFYAKKKWCNIKDCLNKRIARHVMLYPPGIPIICLGERLTTETIHYIENLQEKLQGIKRENGTIQVEVLAGIYR